MYYWYDSGGNVDSSASIEYWPVSTLVTGVCESEQRKIRKIFSNSHNRVNVSSAKSRSCGFTVLPNRHSYTVRRLLGNYDGIYTAATAGTSL